MEEDISTVIQPAMTTYTDRTLWKTNVHIIHLCGIQRPKSQKKRDFNEFLESQNAHTKKIMEKREKLKKNIQDKNAKAMEKLNVPNKNKAKIEWGIKKTYWSIEYHYEKG